MERTAPGHTINDSSPWKGQQQSMEMTAPGHFINDSSQWKGHQATPLTGFVALCSNIPSYPGCLPSGTTAYDHFVFGLVNRNSTSTTPTLVAKILIVSQQSSLHIIPQPMMMN